MGLVNECWIFLTVYKRQHLCAISTIYSVLTHCHTIKPVNKSQPRESLAFLQRLPLFTAWFDLMNHCRFHNIDLYSLDDILFSTCLTVQLLCGLNHSLFIICFNFQGKTDSEWAGLSDNLWFWGSIPRIRGKGK